LLRLVAGTGSSEQGSSPSGGDTWYVVPDPRGTAPGRGAHLHPTPECFALAERRRAFARALRHDAGERGALNLARLEQHLAQIHQSDTEHPVKNGSTSS
jgi:predicted RNA-binding protein YlxR (DUF448 family)